MPLYSDRLFVTGSGTTFNISGSSALGDAADDITTCTGQFTGSQGATFSKPIDITDARDAVDNSGDTGALKVEGGASIAKRVFVGTHLLVSGSAEVAGNLTVGDGGAEDQKIVLDGNAVDFYLGIDDDDDTFKLGLGSAVGTNAALTFDNSGKAKLPLAQGLSGSGPLEFAGETTLGSTLTVSGSTTLGRYASTVATVTSQLTASQGATFSLPVDITSTRDAVDNSGDTGALKVEGGASIAKRVFVGTNLLVSGSTDLGSDCADVLNISSQLTASCGGYFTKAVGIGSQGPGQGTLYVSGSQDSGIPSLRVDHADENVIGIDINTFNTTANAVDIAADRLTLGHMVSASAGALTSGSMLVLASDSPSSAARTLVKIRNDNALATNTTSLHVFQGSRPSGSHDDNLGAAVMIETPAAGYTEDLLSLTNTNADANGPTMSFVKEAEGSAADDDDLGVIKFDGLDSGDDEHTFAKILVESSDVTDSAEGGKMTFSLAATGSLRELLTLGGADAANGTHCGVVVNEGSYDCDFRVESNDETHMLFVDALSNRISIGDSTDLPAATLELTNNASAGASGVPLFQLNSNDVDQIGMDLNFANTTAVAMDIDASNTTANVFDIAADSLTLGHMMSASAGALTSGSMLVLASTSPSAGAKSLVKIKNDNPLASNTSCLLIQQGARPSGSHDDNIGSAVMVETAVAGYTEALLTLSNLNADANGPVLSFAKEAEGSAADDDDLGIINFVGLDSADDEVTFAQILAESSDVTDNDEGGKLTFNVVAGGTAGTAAAANLFSIGGEDVANGTPCEVVVNDASIDCDFRVESDAVTHMFFVDAGNNRIGFANSAPEAALSIGSGMHTITSDVTVTSADSGDNTVIAQLPGVVIPQHAIITRVIAVVKTASNLSTHLCNIQLSSTNGTAADSSISSGTEILGAGMGADAEDAYSTDNPGGDTKEDINLKEAKEVFLSEGILSVDADKFVYVCNAGTGNGTSNASSGVLTVIIEYFGMT
tara:strand:- start:2905 stop:5916 length:3012 start_codon:yes stop_codon:yes gene_type:complete